MWAYGTYAEENGKILKQVSFWEYTTEPDIRGYRAGKYINRFETIPEEYQPVV